VTGELTGRVLGVDLGERRIGLALSDPSRTIASPLEVITRGNDRDQDRRAIAEVARTHGATLVVVGLPRSLSGRDGPAALAARAEADAIAAVAPDLRVVLHDERLTTVEAQRSLDAAGVRKDRGRTVIDKVAAAVMLQSYLDAGPSTGGRG
jgi:putative Holliday junction resolvase